MPIKIIFISLFVLISCSLSAQRPEEYDTEYLARIAQAETDAVSLEKLKRKQKKENLIYPFEISFDTGIHGRLKNSENLLDAGMFSLQGAYFLSTNGKWGVRSGMSFSSGFDASDLFINVPLLISFRTFALEYPPTLHDIVSIGYQSRTFGEALINSLLFIIPKRVEFNAGPVLGYFSGHDSNITNNGYFIDKPIALSFDAGARLTFKIWRFGLVFSPTGSWLISRNFKYISPNTNYKKDQPVFFMKITGGLSFRF